MPEKRAYPGELQNSDLKRSKAPDGSPVSADKSATNGSVDEATRKAQVAERIAALKARRAGAQNGSNPAAPLTQAAPPPAPASVSVPPGSSKASDDKAAGVAAQIAALKARIAARANASPGQQTPAVTAPNVEPPSRSDTRTRDQIRSEIESISRPPARPTPDVGPDGFRHDDAANQARGGLGIGLHPALFEDLTAKSTGRGGKGRRKGNEAPDNPYLSLGNALTDDQRIPDESFDPTHQKQRNRKTRAITLNPKGKYIAQAEALRAEERLEKLNREIQQAARQKEIEEATERSFLVKDPPDIEWWDEGLVNGTDYTNITAPGKIRYDAITQYIQHPVLLDPPQERNAPAPKAMYLTKKEQARLRRQRRMADHKEEQAKIRLGLVEPPAPKVKKSNLMRVLGQEAVRDPTAVEARVRRDMEQRVRDHEGRNAERALTTEQRHEKLAAQQEADAARGIQIAVFRVEHICSRKHRFQIDKNAAQMGLTGTVVLNPAMNLVVAEGGAHGIKFYKNLMLNRIRWAENTVPVQNGGDVERVDRQSEQHEFLQAVGKNGALRDLSGNKCTLVWEGSNKERQFKRWRSAVCETDGQAKNALARAGMENMWALAQNIFN